MIQACANAAIATGAASGSSNSIPAPATTYGRPERRVVLGGPLGERRVARAVHADKSCHAVLLSEASSHGTPRGQAFDLTCDIRTKGRTHPAGLGVEPDHVV